MSLAIGLNVFAALLNAAVYIAAGQQPLNLVCFFVSGCVAAVLYVVTA